MRQIDLLSKVEKEKVFAISKVPYMSKGDKIKEGTSGKQENSTEG